MNGHETIPRHLPEGYLQAMRSWGGIRFAAIVKGLWADPGHGHEHGWIEAAKQPVTYDRGVATRQHRDPKIRRHMSESFKLYMAQVTDLEERVLGLFKIDINAVREAALTGEAPKSSRFKFDDRLDRMYVRLVQHFGEDILGTEMAGNLREDRTKAVEEIEAIYPNRSLLAFSLGLQKTFDDILKELPDYVDPKDLERRMVHAALQNQYLRSMVDVGGTRIRTVLAKEYMTDVREMLDFMASTGEGSLAVGKWLHEAIGEGKAWYWQRITRSEAALACNAAFDAQGEALGTNYEMWDAGPDCCDICAYYSGKVWKFREGPQPVSDSHPHCLCGRNPLLDKPANKAIQDKWAPGADPYTPEGRAELLRRISGGVKPPRAPVQPPVPAAPPAVGMRITDIRTPEDLGQYLKLMWPDLDTSIPSITDVDSLQQIAAGFKRLNDLGYNSKTFGKITDIMHHVDAYAEGQGALPKNNYINLNRNYFGNNAAFLKQLQKDVLTGWHPNGCDTLESVIIHEFGHVLSGRDLWTKMGIYRDIMKVRRDYMKALRTFIQSNATAKAKDMPGYISNYAIYRGKLGEFVSESLAMVLCSRNPSPFAIRVVQILINAYGGRLP